MKYKHSDIEIPKEQPFANCQLERENCANILTQIIGNYADGFVMSINGEWGAGKSTFIKMWKQQLLNQDYKCVYFNAWENDFSSNPFVAILAEIEDLFNSDDESRFNKILENAGCISRNILPTLIRIASEKYLGEGIAQIAEALTKESNEIFKQELTDYKRKKKQISELRSSISDYIKSKSENKPVVFIIDELDRCRPDYAVEVLETIKHLFSIPGIVFILAIDKEQLCNAIKGFYGSDKIDAVEYLRRFIDIEYILSRPSIRRYCNYLYQFFDFASFIECDHRKNTDRLVNDKEHLLEFAIALCEERHLTLRQIEKLFVHMRLTLRSVGENRNIFARSAFMLIYIRATDAKLYSQIIKSELTLQELVDKLSFIYPKTILKDNYGLTGKGVYALTEFITNYAKGSSPNAECYIYNGNNPRLTFEAKWLNEDELAKAIQRYYQYDGNNNWEFIKMSIDLLNNIIRD